MKTVVVTGATGFVGTAVVNEMTSHGYRVRALHRKTSSLPEYTHPDRVDLIEGDITAPKSLENLCTDCEFVFHIAALFREAKHGPEQYRLVNVEGTRNMLEAAKRASVRRFIHCSTVGVHSHIPEPPADETEAFRPADVYQESKCDGEKLALEFFEKEELFGVVIRPAMIWGPGDKRTLKLFRGISRKRLPIIGTGETLLHWILVTDLARAFRLAAETEELRSGEAFIISGKHSIRMRELYDLIGEAVGVKPLPFRIPALPVQMAGQLCETICKPFGIEPPLYRRRVDFFTKTRAFDSSKARRLLGFEATGDLRSEIDQIARWYQEKGWLASAGVSHPHNPRHAQGPF